MLAGAMLECLMTSRQCSLKRKFLLGQFCLPTREEGTMYTALDEKDRLGRSPGRSSHPLGAKSHAEARALGTSRLWPEHIIACVRHCLASTVLALCQEPCRHTLGSHRSAQEAPLTATQTSFPALRHCSHCLSASLSTYSVKRPMHPICSASGMKLAGELMPDRGCSQVEMKRFLFDRFAQIAGCIRPGSTPRPHSSYSPASPGTAPRQRWGTPIGSCGKV